MILNRDLVTRAMNLSTADIMKAFADNGETEKLSSSEFSGVVTMGGEIVFAYTVRYYDDFLGQDAVARAYIEYDAVNKLFVASY